MWNCWNYELAYKSNTVIRPCIYLARANKLTDRDTLYQSETIFRGLIIDYSSALAASSVADLAPLAVLGSQLAYALYGVPIDAATVQYLLEYAVLLCSPDFMDFMDDTIVGIKDTLELD